MKYMEIAVRIGSASPPQSRWAIVSGRLRSVQTSRIENRVCVVKIAAFSHNWTCLSTKKPLRIAWLLHSPFCATLRSRLVGETVAVESIIQHTTLFRRRH